MCCNLTWKSKSTGKLKTVLSYKLIHLTVLYICIKKKKKGLLYIELCLWYYYIF